MKPITDRQREVIHAMSCGLSQSQIGERLGISLQTVHHHLLNLYHNVGVSGLPNPGCRLVALYALAFPERIERQPIALTPTQHNAITLLATGMEVAQIGERLGYRPSSMKNILGAAYAPLRDDGLGTPSRRLVALVTVMGMDEQVDVEVAA